MKELAHAAHRSLEARAGSNLRRSHMYELLAAAFGYQSWAAFLSDSLLVDAGLGQKTEGVAPRVIGRAVQLHYEQAAASAMAQALEDFTAERQLGALRWSALDHLQRPTPCNANEDDLDGEAPEDWDQDEPPRAPVTGSEPTRERLLTSPLLLSSLELAAASRPRGHQVLAAIYRCAKPNPYLYEESLKGRASTAVEQGWVDEYLRLGPH